MTVLLLMLHCVTLTYMAMHCIHTLQTPTFLSKPEPQTHANGWQQLHWVVPAQACPDAAAAAHRPCAMLPPFTVLQTASFLFKPGFLAAGGASSALLEPLLRILSLGWSSAAVTNYVQGVSCKGCALHAE